MNQTSELSEREIEILKLVATGLSNKEIAYQLKISPNTVKVHLKNIFGKIGVVSRTEAAMFAVRQGWVEAGNQAALEVVEAQEGGDLSKASQIAFSPLFLGLLGVGLFAGMIILVVLLVNLASRSNPRVVEIVVTPTPEPVKWELVTQMPEPKKSMAYAAVENKIYIIGGETPHGISDRVDIYDTVTGQWSEGARKPTSVSEACGAYLDGKIIVAGGKKPDGLVTNVVEAYDVAGNTWELLPGLTHPLAGAGCVAYEGGYFLFGGWDGEMVKGEVWEYDNNQWKYKTRIKERAYLSVEVVNETFYVIGGWNGVDELSEITRLNFYSTNEERPLVLPEARRNLVVVGIVNNLYIIGGINSTDDIGYSIELNPYSGLIRVIKNPKQDNWYDLGAVWVGEYLYGFGGVSGGHIIDDLYYTRAIYTVILPVIAE